MQIIDRPNLRASLWAVVYTFLVIVVSNTMIKMGVSPFIVVPVVLFVLPLIACVPFLFWLKPITNDVRG